MGINWKRSDISKKLDKERLTGKYLRRYPRKKPRPQFQQNLTLRNKTYPIKLLVSFRITTETKDFLKENKDNFNWKASEDNSVIAYMSYKKTRTGLFGKTTSSKYQRIILPAEAMEEIDEIHMNCIVSDRIKLAFNSKTKEAFIEFKVKDDLKW